MSMIEAEPMHHPGSGGGSWTWDGCRWVCNGRPGPGPCPPTPGPCPPPPWPGPDRPLNGPIVGVTDGKPAQAGMVGEYVSKSTTIAAVSPQTIYNVSAIILPPGDWDMSASARINFPLVGANITMNPVPPGVSDVFWAQAWGAVGSTEATDTELETGLHLHTSRLQVNVSVPTLLAWTITLYSPQFNLPGTGWDYTIYFFVSARRMR